MDMSDELMRQQHSGWTLWCRAFGYRSYKNVFAVWLCREGDTCEQQVHKVYGCLGNGQYFGGFLVRSQVRKHAFAAISDRFSSGFADDRRGGHWVIVKAESEQAAIEHEDVTALRDRLMGDHDHEVFCGVYFISNGNGAVKIGQTASNINGRLGQLQAASPYDLTVCAVIDTKFQRRLEHKIHVANKHRRMRGEWFAMTDEEAVAIAIAHGGRAVCRRVDRSAVIPKCFS